MPIYCRPLRVSETDEKGIERMPVPDEAEKLSVAFLPAMSGLTSNETRLDEGAINVRIGEGRTAEVYGISAIRFRWMEKNGKSFVNKSAICSVCNLINQITFQGVEKSR